MGRAAFLYLGISTLGLRNYTNNFRTATTSQSLSRIFQAGVAGLKMELRHPTAIRTGRILGNRHSCSLECVFSTDLAYLQMAM